MRTNPNRLSIFIFDLFEHSFCPFCIFMIIRFGLILMSIFVFIGSGFAVDNAKSLFTAKDDVSYDGEAEDVNLI